MAVARKPDINPLMARLSLRRSRIRTRILMFMDKSGKAVSIKDVSDAMKCSYSITYGALMGNGKHYSEELALRNVGLVEANDLGGKIYFSLTANGREEVCRIQEEGGSNDRDVGPDEEVR